MKNKELALRRMQTLEGRLASLRLSLNERDIEKCRELFTQIVEIKEDLKSIIEREN
jgi:DNA-binding FrmR family transcriptional regulator